MSQPDGVFSPRSLSVIQSECWRKFFVGDVHPSMLPRSFAVSTVSGFEQTRDCVQWTDPTKVWWVALHCFSGRGTPSRTLDFAGICCHRHGFLEIKPHDVFARFSAAVRELTKALSSSSTLGGGSLNVIRPTRMRICNTLAAKSLDFAL